MEGRKLSGLDLGTEVGYVQPVLKAELHRDGFRDKLNCPRWDSIQGSHTPQPNMLPLDHCDPIYSSADKSGVVAYFTTEEDYYCEVVSSGVLRLAKAAAAAAGVTNKLPRQYRKHR